MQPSVERDEWIGASGHKADKGRAGTTLGTLSEQIRWTSFGGGISRGTALFTVPIPRGITETTRPSGVAIALGLQVQRPSSSYGLSPRLIVARKLVFFTPDITSSALATASNLRSSSPAPSSSWKDPRNLPSVNFQQAQLGHEAFRARSADCSPCVSPAFIRGGVGPEPPGQCSRQTQTLPRRRCSDLRLYTLAILISALPSTPPSLNPNGAR